MKKIILAVTNDNVMNRDNGAEWVNWLVTCAWCQSSRRPISTQQVIVIVIVISEHIERHAKAKRTRAPAYSAAKSLKHLRQRTNWPMVVEWPPHTIRWCHESLVARSLQMHRQSTRLALQTADGLSPVSTESIMCRYCMTITIAGSFGVSVILGDTLRKNISRNLGRQLS